MIPFEKNHKKLPLDKSDTRLSLQPFGLIRCWRASLQRLSTSLLHLKLSRSYPNDIIFTTRRCASTHPTFIHGSIPATIRKQLQIQSTSSSVNQ